VKIEWSPRAERELTQLRDYIAQDSPFYARQFTERLLLAVERLALLPHSGRTVPEAGHQDTIREVLYQGYRLIYRIFEAQQLVQIVTVLHSARSGSHGTALATTQAVVMHDEIRKTVGAFANSVPELRAAVQADNAPVTVGALRRELKRALKDIPA